MSYTRCLFVLGLLFTNAAFAQIDLSGDWRGKLAVDATTSLPVQFTFTQKADGSFSAVLNSLESEYIKNVPAATVTLKRGALKVEVPALTGSYSGALREDHFEGQWTQTGSKPIALALSRPPKATKADLQMLTGSWRGPIPGPAKASLVLDFQPDAKGVLGGTLSVPEQNANRFPMVNLEIEPGTLSFKVLAVGGEFKGTYSRGAIVGALDQGARKIPITLTRAETAESFYPLKVNAEQFSALYGNWKAKVGELDRTLRFTLGPSSSFAAFVDLPEARTTAPVTDSSAAGKTIVLKVESLHAEFSGELAGKTLAGQWTQDGRTTPVTWTKQ